MARHLGAMHLTRFLRDSIKDLPILQDAPPPGGFPSIRIERRLPNTGPTGVAIFAGGLHGAFLHSAS